MSLNLVLDYESSALAAPQSFRDAMQAAANILDAAILDNITVTIRVGYGDWNNNQDTGITTGAEGGSLNGLTVSYASLRTALATHETSTVDQTFVSSLPSASSVNGVSSFFVPSAVAKAVGLLSPTTSGVDGAVGMGTQIPTNLLVGAALHELSHAMGREPGVGPFDLFRYTSAGNHLFTSGSTAVPAYFSIDGGNTKLADFGQTSDASDFLTSGIQGSNDPFDEFYNSHTIQNLTNVDKELLDVMGFNTTALVATVIESAGATSLTEIGNHFYLYDSTGAGPSLKFQGADYVPGQFGAAVVPIGAEATVSGYEVAWKVMGTDIYSVWATDKNGNYTSNIIGNASGTSTTLESIESSFQQDLNGDGHIGVVLNGSSGGQTLTASGGTTTLIGGPNDILSAGAGADTFVFRPGFGSNTINGFAGGTDAIQFDNTIFADMTDVQNHMQQIGSDVEIAHDPQNVVTLHDVLLANLHTSDFHIV
jgi:serralysin